MLSEIFFIKGQRNGKIELLEIHDYLMSQSGYKFKLFHFFDGIIVRDELKKKYFSLF